MSFAAMILVACLIDAVIGWPDAVYRRIGHPVTWMGRSLDAFTTRWNTGHRSERLWRGGGTVLLLVGVTAGFAAMVQALLPSGLIGVLLGGVLAWPFLALRSLHDHVNDVAAPLAKGDLPGARRAVSRIVGRDPDALDEAGIARAALESLAENASDGVIAPVFWGLVAGLPGIAAYKAINTADSMIGHRDTRFEAFGKVAARVDDIVNLVPARLSGVLFALVSGKPVDAMRTMWRDAARHRSPNAGWPESALAAALGVRLSGPRRYGDTVVDEPWLNSTAPDPDHRSLVAGLAVYRRSMIVMAACLLFLSLV